MATSLNNLALVHWTMGTYDEARDLYERALAIQEKALGPEHPHVAASLNNLAFVHQATGSYEHANELYERALDIGMRLWGRSTIMSRMRSLGSPVWRSGRGVGRMRWRSRSGR